MNVNHESMGEEVIMNLFIKSEIYKIVKSRFSQVIFTSIVSLSLCISILICMNTTNVGELFYIYRNVILVLFALSPIVGEIVFRNEYSYGTFKNMVSYGIYRNTMLFGRLIICILIEVLFIVAIIIPALICVMLFNVNNLGGVGNEIVQLGKIVIESLPLLISGIVICNSLLFIIEDKLDYIIVFLIIVFVPNIILGLASFADLGKIEVYNKYLITTNLIQITNRSNVNYSITLILSLIYIIFFFILGVSVLKRKEIK